MTELESFLENVLGVYTPNTFTIGSDVYIPSGAAGVDIGYCIRAAIFLVVLWALLRILGGMLCRK